MNEDDPERGGLEFPPGRDLHVVPLTDVVDVDRDGGVRSDAVLLHQGDQLRLGQVVRGRSLPLLQLHLRNSASFRHVSRDRQHAGHRFTRVQDATFPSKTRHRGAFFLELD